MKHHRIAAVLVSRRARSRLSLRRRRRRTPRPKAPASAERRRRRHAGRAPVVEGAQEKFNAALDAFVAHDKANDWNDATCAEVAKTFDDARASKQKGRRSPRRPSTPASRTSAAATTTKREGAVREGAQATTRSSTTRASQLALYQYKADSERRRRDRRARSRPSRDAQFQNVPALVNLAMFQMKRDGVDRREQDCKDDIECAKKNLQRALAIDDALHAGVQPARALLLRAREEARGRASRARKRAVARSRRTPRWASAPTSQQLELAALVVLAGDPQEPELRADPQHGRAHPERARSGQRRGRASSPTAAKLDPKFFEAQMNYAAVNLVVPRLRAGRGRVPRRRSTMRPNDYDAHLGLALALRGQIDDSNYDKQRRRRAGASSTRARSSTPDRPDAYYNEGILTQEYKAKAAAARSRRSPRSSRRSSIFQHVRRRRRAASPSTPAP